MMFKLITLLPLALAAASSVCQPDYESAHALHRTMLRSTRNPSRRRLPTDEAEEKQGNLNLPVDVDVENPVAKSKNNNGAKPNCSLFSNCSPVKVVLGTLAAAGTLYGINAAINAGSNATTGAIQDGGNIVIEQQDPPSHIGLAPFDGNHTDADLLRERDMMQRTDPPTNFIEEQLQKTDELQEQLARSEAQLNLQLQKNDELQEQLARSEEQRTNPTSWERWQNELKTCGPMGKMCIYSNDGQCDEKRGNTNRYGAVLCEDGTDCLDCGSCWYSKFHEAQLSDTEKVTVHSKWKAIEARAEEVRAAALAARQSEVDGTAEESESDGE